MICLRVMNEVRDDVVAPVGSLSLNQWREEVHQLELANYGRLRVDAHPLHRGNAAASPLMTARS